MSHENTPLQVRERKKILAKEMLGLQLTVEEINTVGDFNGRIIDNIPEEEFPLPKLIEVQNRLKKEVLEEYGPIGRFFSYELIIGEVALAFYSSIIIASIIRGTVSHNIPWWAFFLVQIPYRILWEKERVSIVTFSKVYNFQAVLPCFSLQIKKSLILLTSYFLLWFFGLN